jgi:MerR family transcriptional regulator, light-induced transcriptional regulator
MSELGIGDLARRTGLTPQVIRAWETRFDFPQPRRTPTGRRVYDARDVDRIGRVLTLKASGSRLAQAIARVVDQGDPAGRDLSVYGELRRLLPHLESRVMRRDVLGAISRAIEDEALARAVRPVVFGAFQREEFYLRSARRWQELARTADGCVVFADFPVASASGARPVRVPLERDSPLLREWAVVVSSADFSTVLTGWELPDAGHSGERRFETIFSFEPEAVRVAVDTCLAAARSAGVPEEALVRDQGTVPTDPPRTSSPGVDALVLRAFGYLQELPPPA